MGQNRVEVSLHFVWGTWDRLPLIKPDLERELYRYISAVCQDDGCDVLAIGGMPDHVHLLVLFGTTVSISELMRHVKGGSSRFISETPCSGDWFRWQAGYGVFCVEPKNRAKIISYIHNQKQRHADGATWPAVEATSSEFPVPAKAVTRLKVT